MKWLSFQKKTQVFSNFHFSTANLVSTNALPILWCIFVINRDLVDNCYIKIVVLIWRKMKKCKVIEPTYAMLMYVSCFKYVLMSILHQIFEMYHFIVNFLSLSFFQRWPNIEFQKSHIQLRAKQTGHLVNKHYQN